MHRNPTPHTWMHRNRHPSSKCTGILPLTQKCMKSSLLRWMHWNPTPHTWMHRNYPPSSKCTRILPLTHECTEMVSPQVNATESYPSHINAPTSSLLRSMHRNLTPYKWMRWNHHLSNECTGILRLTHVCTEIVIPQVKAPKSYPSHMNAPKSWSLM